MPARRPARSFGSRSGRKESQQSTGGADLHLVERRQRAEFVHQRAQVFDLRLDSGHRADLVAQTSADRLKKSLNM